MTEEQEDQMLVEQDKALEIRIKQISELPRSKAREELWSRVYTHTLAQPFSFDPSRQADLAVIEFDKRFL